MDYGVEYSGFPTLLEGYKDADQIFDLDETKFISGYVFTLGDGTVAWRSSKQTIIARPTMESKFVTLDMVGSEAKCLTKFLDNITLGMKPTPSMFMHCDSQPAIAMAKNKTYNGKNRHI